MPFRSIDGLRIAFVLLLCTGGAATGFAQDTQPKLTVPDQKLCSDPRPQMCNDLYQPVCGFTKDETYRTYSNSCFACMKSDDVRYTPGKCKKAD